jgi:hypothetical protein
MITYTWLHHPLSHNLSTLYIKTFAWRDWEKPWKVGLSGISTKIWNGHPVNAWQGCYCCTNLYGKAHYYAVLFKISITVWILVSNTANFYVKMWNSILCCDQLALWLPCQLLEHKMCVALSCFHDNISTFQPGQLAGTHQWQAPIFLLLQCPDGIHVNFLL